MGVDSLPRNHVTIGIFGIISGPSGAVARIVASENVSQGFLSNVAVAS